MLSVMPAQQHNPFHQHKTQTSGRHVIGMQNVGDKEDEEHIGGHGMRKHMTTTINTRSLRVCRY